MGTQRMGSRGGHGRQQEPKVEGLVRQGSLYSLTLDEVENQLGDLGKPLSSMNLDELLKTVWTVEANQALGGGIEYGSSLPQGQLSSQLSLGLSRGLSKKTVDEVWQDIQHQQMNSSSFDRLNQRQRTLGEMTLEDFLVKAGVVAESSSRKRDSAPCLGTDLMIMPQQQQQVPWMNYAVPLIQQQQQQQQQQLGIFMAPQHTAMVEGSYNPENQMTMSSSPLMGTSPDTQMPGRRRGGSSGDIEEKTVERRHKRMIKNRESAARSRARKQAYTNELENKVSQLEKENRKLKRQKEFEKILPSVPLPEPKYQLRRTSSAPF